MNAGPIHFSKLDQANARRNITMWLENLKSCVSGNMKHVLPDGYFYFGYGDFLLQHGKWYEPQPLPRSIKRGAPRHCFGNSIIASIRRPDLQYVEGYAIGPILPLPIHHAWVTDGENAFDTTWRPEGGAYFGVEFSIERADDACWNGDAAILEDWKRHHPLLHEGRWPGKDTKVFPPSRRIKMMQKAFAYVERARREA